MKRKRCRRRSANDESDIYSREGEGRAREKDELLDKEENANAMWSPSPEIESCGQIPASLRRLSARRLSPTTLRSPQVRGGRERRTNRNRCRRLGTSTTRRGRHRDRGRRSCRLQTWREEGEEGNVPEERQPLCPRTSRNGRQSTRSSCKGRKDAVSGRREGEEDKGTHQSTRRRPSLLPPPRSFSSSTSARMNETDLYSNIDPGSQGEDATQKTERRGRGGQQRRYDEEEEGERNGEKGRISYEEW